MHQIGAEGVYFVNINIIKGKGEVKIRVNKVNGGFKNEHISVGVQIMP